MFQYYLENIIKHTNIIIIKWGSNEIEKKNWNIYCDVVNYN